MKNVIANKGAAVLGLDALKIADGRGAAVGKLKTRRKNAEADLVTEPEVQRPTSSVVSPQFELKPEDKRWLTESPVRSVDRPQQVDLNNLFESAPYPS